MPNKERHMAIKFKKEKQWGMEKGLFFNVK